MSQQTGACGRNKSSLYLQQRLMRSVCIMTTALLYLCFYCASQWGWTHEYLMWPGSHTNETKQGRPSLYSIVESLRTPVPHDDKVGQVVSNIVSLKSYDYECLYMSTVQMEHWPFAYRVVLEEENPKPNGDITCEIRWFVLSYSLWQLLRLWQCWKFE